MSSSGDDFLHERIYSALKSASLQLGAGRRGRTRTVVEFIFENNELTETRVQSRECFHVVAST
jgi:hypothetical protein